MPTKKKKDPALKKAAKRAKKKGKAELTGEKHYTTIDDLLQQQASQFNMVGNEILTTEQCKIVLTQIALGNAKDGLTQLPPSTSERMQAVKQLTDLQKNDVSTNAIDQHNESIRIFEIENNNVGEQRTIDAILEDNDNEANEAVESEE
jgi:hypothetical protein